MAHDNEHQNAHESNARQGAKRRRILRAMGGFFEKNFRFEAGGEPGTGYTDFMATLNPGNPAHRDITNGTELPYEHPDADAEISLPDFDPQGAVETKFSDQDMYDRMLLHTDTALTAEHLVAQIDQRTGGAPAHELSPEEMPHRPDEGK